MRTGICWEAVCSKCDHASSCVWQDERPEEVPCACGWCLAPGMDATWTRTEVKPLGYMRQSGFSSSESDFVPHFNRAFGRRVGSLAEMKALQAQHGTTDAVVKGDGAERHAPRDITSRVKHHAEVAERLARSEGIGHSGVRVTYTEDSGD